MESWVVGSCAGLVQAITHTSPSWLFFHSSGSYIFFHHSLIFPGTWIGQGGWYEWPIYDLVLTITNSQHFNQLWISALTTIHCRSFSDQGWKHHKLRGINIDIKRKVWQYDHFARHHQWIPSLGPVISLRLLTRFIVPHMNSRVEKVSSPVRKGLVTPITFIPLL